MNVYPRHPRVNTFWSSRSVRKDGGGCLVHLLYRDGLLDDLDPSCGLAFGRVAGVGVAGRLTGVFSFILFIAF